MSNIFHLDNYRIPLANADERNIRLSKLLLDAEIARQLMLAARAPSAKNLLASATPVLLYQVSWGRNAWQSKWVARYQRNTLCQSLAGARKFVNDRRKQGSAYRLLVTPGWYLQFDRKAYLVGEINTSMPFARLVKPAFLKVGITEIECLRLLNPTSEIWSGPTPQHDSVVVQETSLAPEKFVSWSDHTKELGGAKTPGRYRRTIAGDRWYFAPVFNPTSGAFDTSRFEAFIDCSTEVVNL